MKNCLSRLWLWLAASSLVLTAAAKSPEPEVGMTVQLPPFIVERPGGATLWRYLKIPRFEVLSTCSEATTWQLALSFHRAHELLGLVLPPKFQVAFASPQAVILYDQKLWPENERAAVAALLQAEDSAPPTTNEGRSITGTQPEWLTRANLVDRTVSGEGHGRAFLKNLLLSDVDSTTTFVLAGDGALDPQRPHLTADYINLLLEGRTPALPVWFVAGFKQLYPGMEFRPRTVTLSLPRRSETERLPPLDRLLQDSLPPESERDRWRDDVQLFICWGFDPDGGRAESFWRFLDRASAAAPTESTFRECFGLGYEEAAAQVEQYGRTARSLRWTLPTGWDRLPDGSVQEASSGQVARIKGEWERLEARYVQHTNPALTSQYVALARRTLHKAYDRGDRDPSLLASLGLLELELGEKAAAPAFLEEVQSHGMARPRAAFELAFLRYESLLGRSRRDDGKFPSAQIEPLLVPLLVAAQQSPPLAAVFQLMAEAGTMGIEPPSPEVLAALAAGVRLFPTHRDLAAKVASLYRLAGRNDEADAVLALGAGRQPRPPVAAPSRLNEIRDQFLKVDLLP